MSPWKRPWSIGAAAVVAVYFVVVAWAIIASGDFGMFLVGLPWSYFVGMGPWQGTVAAALTVPCIILNAVLIYAGVAIFTRFTAASFETRSNGNQSDI